MATIPMDQRDGMLWLDGELVPWCSARIHVLTHGLHYASCVFEGERAYAGRVFRLEEHGRRLLLSRSILDLDCPYAAGELDLAVREVIAANGIEDGYVRRLAWRGAEQLGVAAHETRVHVAIAAWPWPHYFGREAREQGLRLAFAEWRRPDPATAPTRAKASCLYAIGTLAKHAAERAGYDDALMLDWRGRIAEATGANIFFVRDGVLHTPTPDGFLDGITRQAVIALARARELTVLERSILPDELRTFTECFVTGTAAEVMPVRAIGPFSFAPGAITRALVDDFARLVRPDPFIADANAA